MKEKTKSQTKVFNILFLTSGFMSSIALFALKYVFVKPVCERNILATLILFIA